DLDVGIAVVRVLDFGALAEDGIRLIEEQDGAACPRIVEETREIFLGFPDVLAHDARKIDSKQLQTHLASQHLSRHRLAGARLAAEERRETAAKRHPAAEAPLLEDTAAVAHPRSSQIKFIQQFMGQHQIAARVGLRQSLRNRSHCSRTYDTARL